MVETAYPDEGLSTSDYQIKRETPPVARYRAANRNASILKSIVSGLNDYSQVTSKTTNIQITQLATDVLSIVGQGEKSVSFLISNHI